ncbi:hypothetical protein MTR_6g033665 [Medicago truncatula]|uniref:Uncharacterized protein n=1 Tax=Medicago truncatula TaxID=3880 RepID=A0A072U7N6_MEDTR|nr:hypothetical protein MTR_6g033665 [Medicago truncatula]
MSINTRTRAYNFSFKTWKFKRKAGARSIKRSVPRHALFLEKSKKQQRNRKRKGKARASDTKILFHQPLTEHMAAISVCYGGKRKLRIVSQWDHATNGWLGILEFAPPKVSGSIHSALNFGGLSPYKACSSFKRGPRKWAVGLAPSD